MHFSVVFLRKRFQILIFSAIVAFILGITLFFYLHQVKNTLTETFNVSLYEVLNQQEANIDFMFQDRVLALESFAAFFARETVTQSPERLLEFLHLYKEKSPFEVIFYANKNGFSHATTNKTYEVSTEEFFTTAMNGNPCIIAPVASRLDGLEVCLIAVPVYNTAGDIIGVLGGSWKIEFISSLMTESYGGFGYSYVISPQNGVIAATKNASLGQDELATTRELWANNPESKICTYKNKTRHFMMYKKLNINDWYLITVATEDALTENLTPLWRGAFIAVIFNFLTFSIVITLIIILQANHLTELAQVTCIDTVTGGITLQKFMKEAEDFLAEFRSGITAVCMDIDEFRIINDMYGFKEGNYLLKTTYEQLKRGTRTNGLLCRVSNDVFYILVHHDGAEETLKTQQLRFEEFLNDVLQKSGRNYRVTFTFGFYSVPQDVINPSVIFARANHVHNRAKKRGISSEFYQELFHETAIKRKLIENTMHEAFDNFEFKMFLQPKYDLLNKTLQGAEALIRWESPSGKQFPDDFIPVFEKTGFIIQTDLYMMERACQILREWIDLGVRPVPISVNQSKLLLLNPLYFNVITGTLERYRIPANLIEIEITETIMYENSEALNALIERLHSYGLRIAIDDFGSGYSSLLLLRDIKADVLKIDKEFIYKAENDIAGRKILSSIIQLADSLGMSILAEGIETKAQADLLTYLGCHIAQGYLYGKPIPVESFVRQQMAV